MIYIKTICLKVVGCDTIKHMTYSLYQKITILYNETTDHTPDNLHPRVTILSSKRKRNKQ